MKLERQKIATVGKTGQISIGSKFAGQTVAIEEMTDGNIVIKQVIALKARPSKKVLEAQYDAYIASAPIRSESIKEATAGLFKDEDEEEDWY